MQEGNFLIHVEFGCSPRHLSSQEKFNESGCGEWTTTYEISVYRGQRLPGVRPNVDSMHAITNEKRCTWMHAHTHKLKCKQKLIKQINVETAQKKQTNCKPARGFALFQKLKAHTHTHTHTHTQVSKQNTTEKTNKKIKHNKKTNKINNKQHKVIVHA